MTERNATALIAVCMAPCPKKIMLVVFAITLTFLSACSTVNLAHSQSEANLRGFKSAYVVTHGGSSADMDAHIQNALIDRGLKVRAGPESARPADVDFYVTYADSWRWDIVMYLKALQIQFYDGKTGTLITSGSFSNSLFHSWPDAGAKVAEVISTMYGDQRLER